MVKDAIDAIESLSRDNMFIEQALIQIAFALIFKLHVAFGGDFPEAAVARHNDIIGQLAYESRSKSKSSMPGDGRE